MRQSKARKGQRTHPRSCSWRGWRWTESRPFNSSIHFYRHSVAKLCLTLCDPWKAAACQPSLSFTISWSLVKFIESVMLSKHLILCCPLLFLPSIFPSIRVFHKFIVPWLLFLNYTDDKINFTDSPDDKNYKNENTHTYIYMHACTHTYRNSRMIPWFCCSVARSSDFLRPHGMQHVRLPVLHYLLEFARIHVLWVSDAIYLTIHPLPLVYPFAFNLSQHQSLFQWVSSSHQVTKVLEPRLQPQFFQRVFRVDVL